MVREAFEAYSGVDAMSCDLLPAEDGRDDYHIQGDVLDVLNDDWDMMIAFPPCTDLAVSGARWFPAKRADGSQQRSIDFFMALATAPIERIAIENPIGIMSSLWRKPDQIIQPWMFGHAESKATCLWLKGLPLLQPTEDVHAAMMRRPLKDRTRVHYASPGPFRWKERSRTLSGIAQAMAAQWLCPQEQLTH